MELEEQKMTQSTEIEEEIKALKMVKEEAKRSVEMPSE